MPEESQLQLRWDYDASVAKMRQFLPRWKDVSIEMLGELYRAREALAPRRPGKIDVSNETSNTWAGYLSDIGLHRATAHRWLKMYDPKRHALIEDQTDNIHFSSESSEWYTPPEIVEKVVALFGTISLDPCSNSFDTPVIPAQRHFTIETDGLEQDWFGKVYMNPPYGREIDKWTMKLLTEYESQRVEEAIALVPSRTDTEWFYSFGAYPRCFVKGRLKFSEMENSAPFPSMVVYLGKRISEFIQTFNDLGDVYQRVTAWT